MYISMKLLILFVYEMCEVEDILYVYCARYYVSVVLLGCERVYTMYQRTLRAPLTHRMCTSLIYHRRE